MRIETGNGDFYETDSPCVGKFNFHHPVEVFWVGSTNESGQDIEWFSSWGTREFRNKFWPFEDVGRFGKHENELRRLRFLIVAGYVVARGLAKEMEK